MNKIFLLSILVIGLTVFSFAAPNSSNRVRYSIRSSDDCEIDVRIVVLNGHEYVVASATGYRKMTTNTGTADVRILHAYSCPCLKPSTNNAWTVIQLPATGEPAMNYNGNQYGPSNTNIQPVRIVPLSSQTSKQN